MTGSRASTSCPRPRSETDAPRYPRALGGAAIAVGMGLASACGASADPYDAPHWNAEPWEPIEQAGQAGACNQEAACWPFEANGTGGTRATGFGGSGGTEAGGEGGAAP